MKRTLNPNLTSHEPDWLFWVCLGVLGVIILLFLAGVYFQASTAQLHQIGAI
jgi:succinate dehydrogenase/fumarate reductase cytochrome b subunit